MNNETFLKISHVQCDESDVTATDITPVHAACGSYNYLAGLFRVKFYFPTI